MSKDLDSNLSNFSARWWRSVDKRFNRDTLARAAVKGVWNGKVFEVIVAPRGEPVVTFFGLDTGELVVKDRWVGEPDNEALVGAICEDGDA